MIIIQESSVPRSDMQSEVANLSSGLSHLVPEFPSDAFEVASF